MPTDTTTETENVGSCDRLMPPPPTTDANGQQNLAFEDEENKTEEKPPLPTDENVEMVNMNPYGGVKADKDKEDTTTYRDYFVPVNTHRKFLRGEKLYLAQNGRSAHQRPWRKIVLCGIIWTFVAAIFLAAALAATGIIASKGTDESSDDERSQRYQSNHSDNHIQRIPEDKKEIKGNFRINNEQFLSSYSDKNSQESLQLTELLETQLMNIFSRLNVSEAKIEELMPGSIVVYYTLRVPHSVSSDDVYEEFISYLNQHQDLIDKYLIDRSSVSFQGISATTEEMAPVTQEIENIPESTTEFHLEEMHIPTTEMDDRRGKSLEDLPVIYHMPTTTTTEAETTQISIETSSNTDNYFQPVTDFPFIYVSQTQDTDTSSTSSTELETSSMVPTEVSNNDTENRLGFGRALYDVFNFHNNSNEEVNQTEFTPIFVSNTETTLSPLSDSETSITPDMTFSVLTSEGTPTPILEATTEKASEIETTPFNFWSNFYTLPENNSTKTENDTGILNSNFTDTEIETMKEMNHENSSLLEATTIDLSSDLLVNVHFNGTHNPLAETLNTSTAINDITSKASTDVRPETSSDEWDTEDHFPNELNEFLFTENNNNTAQNDPMFMASSPSKPSPGTFNSITIMVVNNVTNDNVTSFTIDNVTSDFNMKANILPDGMSGIETFNETSTAGMDTMENENSTLVFINPVTSENISSLVTDMATINNISSVVADILSSDNTSSVITDSTSNDKVLSMIGDNVTHDDVSLVNLMSTDNVSFVMSDILTTDSASSVVADNVTTGIISSTSADTVTGADVISSILADSITTDNVSSTVADTMATENTMSSMSDDSAITDSFLSVVADTVPTNDTIVTDLPTDDTVATFSSVVAETITVDTVASMINDSIMMNNGSSLENNTVTEDNVSAVVADVTKIDNGSSTISVNEKTNNSSLVIADNVTDSSSFMINNASIDLSMNMNSNVTNDNVSTPTANVLTDDELTKITDAVVRYLSTMMADNVTVSPMIINMTTADTMSNSSESHNITETLADTTMTHNVTIGVPELMMDSDINHTVTDNELKEGIAIVPGKNETVDAVLNNSNVADPSGANLMSYNKQNLFDSSVHYFNITEENLSDNSHNLTVNSIISPSLESTSEISTDNNELLISSNTTDLFNSSSDLNLKSNISNDLLSSQQNSTQLLTPPTLTVHFEGFSNENQTSVDNKTLSVSDVRQITNELQNTLNSSVTSNASTTESGNALNEEHFQNTNTNISLTSNETSPMEPNMISPSGRSLPLDKMEDKFFPNSLNSVLLLNESSSTINPDQNVSHIIQNDTAVNSITLESLNKTEEKLSENTVQPIASPDFLSLNKNDSIIQQGNNSQPIIEELYIYPGGNTSLEANITKNQTSSEIDLLVVTENNALNTNNSENTLSNQAVSNSSSEVNSENVLNNQSVSNSASGVNSENILNNQSISNSSSQINSENTLSNQAVSNSSSEVNSENVLNNQSVSNSTSGVNSENILNNQSVSNSSSEIKINATESPTETDNKNQTLTSITTVKDSSNKTSNKIFFGGIDFDNENQTTAMPIKNVTLSPLQNSPNDSTQQINITLLTTEVSTLESTNYFGGTEVQQVSDDRETTTVFNSDVGEVAYESSSSTAGEATETTQESKTGSSSETTVPEILPSPSALEENSLCHRDQFACSTGTVSCIPKSQRCNGQIDCSDASDESGCETVSS